VLGQVLACLKLIDAGVPKDLDLHLVLDNYATHKTPEIHKCLVLIASGTFSLIWYLSGTCAISMRMLLRPSADTRPSGGPGIRCVPPTLVSALIDSEGFRRCRHAIGKN
jgi:hypothetical protein